MAATDQNPLLVNFQNTYGAVPFDEIKLEHFLPAIEVSIQEAKLNLEIIKANPEKPNFTNTVLAIETADERLYVVSSAFHTLKSAESSSELDKLAEKINALLASFGNDLYLDKKLFARVRKVYENRKALNLNPEQARLTEFYYKKFVRNGVALTGKNKKALRQIDKKLAKLCSKFSTNSKESENAFELVITDKKQLKGLPEAAIERAALEAEERNQPDGSYVFTLSHPSVGPVISYADNRSLRQTMAKAWRSVAIDGKYDNRDIVKQIVKLRYRRAKLLGYKTHAEYILDNRMAETPQRVWQFLDDLLVYAKPAAKKDLEALRKFANEMDGLKSLRSWDIGYYQEKLQKKLFDFDSEELRPYFKLENVIQGVFLVAEKLYGLKFYPVDVPVYHPEVKVYEVKDARDKSLGLFYTDFFPRKTKQGGAWERTIRRQGCLHGQVLPAHASIVCNFTKSTPTKPSLLSLDEVGTLFHEFGHALQDLLSECTYQSLAGTNVLWDFVELASQIMENWLMEKECLDLFAFHYETGEKIPDQLIQKVKAAQTFMGGWSLLRQLSLGYLDMHWYDGDSDTITDVAKFEEKVAKKTKLLPAIAGTCYSCSFDHIFSGGYSAGYYSYNWAEVLEADAFEMFKKNGIFDRETARLFRESILARGNTEHPMTLFKKFMGREPNIDALLKRSGLIS